VKLPDQSKPRPAHLLRDRPKIAAQLGDICGQWSHLEGKLAALFAILLKHDALVTDEVFEFIREANQKRIVLENLAKHKVRSSRDRKALLGVLADIQQLAVERNKYVHGRWLVDDLYPDQLIWVRRVGPNWSTEAELVDEQRLADVANKIAQLRNKIDAVVDDAFQARVAAYAIQVTTGRRRKAK
jgi:hypothetical protein